MFLSPQEEDDHTIKKKGCKWILTSHEEVDKLSVVCKKQNYFENFRTSVQKFSLYMWDQNFFWSYAIFFLNSLICFVYNWYSETYRYWSWLLVSTILNHTCNLNVIVTSIKKFQLLFCVKVFMESYFLKLLMYSLFIWNGDRYWCKNITQYHSHSCLRPRDSGHKCRNFMLFFFFFC